MPMIRSCGVSMQKYMFGCCGPRSDRLAAQRLGLGERLRLAASSARRQSSLCTSIAVRAYRARFGGRNSSPGRLGCTEVTHETGQSVQPVVIAGHRVDRLRVRRVGHEELSDVLIDVAGRIDHVARDHRELGPGRRRQSAGSGRVLRDVALAGVAEQHEREVAQLRSLEREVLDHRWRLAAVGKRESLRRDPCASRILGRIAGQRREHVVARVPERQRDSATRSAATG